MGEHAMDARWSRNATRDERVVEICVSVIVCCTCSQSCWLKRAYCGINNDYVLDSARLRSVHGANWNGGHQHRDELLTTKCVMLIALFLDQIDILYEYMRHTFTTTRMRLCVAL